MEKRKFSRFSKRQKDLMFVAGVLIVPIIHFCLFYIYVNAKSFIIAFQDEYTLEFTFDNFTRFIDAFAKDWNKSTGLKFAIGNTLITTFDSMFVISPLSYWLIYCLYKKFYGHMVFRVGFYLPGIFSTVVLSTMSKYVADSNGPYVMLFKAMGIKLPPIVYRSGLLLNNVTGRYWFLFNGFLGTLSGGTILLLTGCLQRVPKDLWDVGRLEGLGMFGEFRLVALPCMWGTVAITWIMSFSASFTSYEGQLLMTGGAYGTQNFGYYLFSETLDATSSGAGFNYPAAVGLLFSAFLVPLSFLLKWLAGKVVQGVEF